MSARPLEPQSNRSPSTMGAALDAALGRFTDGVGDAGIAVALTGGDRPPYVRCHGMAELEWSQPVEPNTVFALASLTKPFTALTVALLARNGLLDLEATVHDYLPAYVGEGRRASLRHLLTHTSGIPNFVTLPGFQDGPAHREHTPDELIAVFAGLPLEFKPGSRYGYSNSGYRLLEVIASTVTRRPFAELLTERVLEPASMTTTRLLNDHDVVPRRARGYATRPDGTSELASHLSMSITGGAGGLAASLEDMVAFDTALRGDVLVDPGLDAFMTTPITLPSGRTEGYGLGWVLTEYRGMPVISHAGGIPGFSSFYGRIPQIDLGIVILSNRLGMDCHTLARSLVDVLAQESSPGPVVEPLDDVPPPVGVYRDTLSSVEITRESGRLVLDDRQSTRRLVPDGAGCHVDSADPEVRVRVHTDPGQPPAITVDYPFSWFTGYSVTS